MAIQANSVGKFYLVGAMLIPTEAERIEGKTNVVVLEPKFLVAPDDNAARNAAVLLVPRDVDVNRVEVFCALPFGR